MSETSAKMSGSCCEASETESSENKQHPKWKIRLMRQTDIAKCLEIWLQVELTEAHQTVQSTLATDPDGFYVAEIDGQVVGMCAGPMTRADTAFMGFYAVAPRYQGIGLGRELWAKTIERLDESKNIGLYGVPAMSAKYKKSGFKIEDSIRMLIYESSYTTDKDGGQKHEIYPERLSSLDGSGLITSTTNKNEWLLVSKSKIENSDESALFEQLVKYDGHVNKFSRRDLLVNYICGDSVPLTVILLMPSKAQVLRGRHCSDGSLAQGAKARSDFQGHSCKHSPNAKTTDQEQDEALSFCAHYCLSISASAQYNDHQDEEGTNKKLQIVGYGCARHDNTGGAMIGPLYADSDHYCEIILRQLVQHFLLQSGGKYSVMTLTSNSSAQKVLEKIGLREIDQCSRMFTKFVPEAHLSKVYFVHSPNFSLF